MRSLFGADFGSPAMNAAYDMMVLDQIEKDDAELAMRDMYGEDFEEEEEEPPYDE